MIKVVGFLARQHGLNVLETLLNDPDYRVTCVFTHRLTAQGEREDFADFVRLTQAHHIPLYSIDSKAEAETIEPILRKLDFDFIVSVSWRRKIPLEILNLAKEGSINLHRGLLPKYPGAEPIKQALHNHEKTIAITAHVMTEEIDAGKPLAFYNHEVNYQENASLEQNIERLKNELTPHFGPLLLEAFENFSEEPEEREIPFKWILIDFDGTLVDTLPTLKKIYADFLQQHGKNPKDEEFEKLNGPTIKEIAQYLKEKYHLTETIEILQNKYEQLLEEGFEKGIKLHPGAEETLSYLVDQGFSLAIVSSAPAKLIQSVLAKYSLQSLVKAIINPAPGQRGKPYPDIYLHALRTLKIKATEALAIEDSENGVQAAAKAGIHVFHFNAEEEAGYREQVLPVKNWHEVKIAIDILKETIKIDEWE